jgi:poly(3-hydroxybutyrate) depolymerase
VKRAYGATTVYVTGMSSGAFMAQRMGYGHPTLVNAVGAASGQIYAIQHGTAPPGLPLPPQSVSVLMLNGDKDGAVDYCGQPNGTGWGNSDFPPSDASLDYWAGSNRCSQQLPQLCTGTTVNAIALRMCWGGSCAKAGSMRSSCAACEKTS